MRSIGVVFRAELSRRWTSWLALSLLVALIGGTVLAGTSTALRTSAAFSSFTKQYGYDAEVFSSSPLPNGYFNLPFVTKVTKDLYYGNGNGSARGQFIPNGDLNVEGLPLSHLSSTIKLLSGRLPTRVHDVIIGLSLEEQYGLRIGSLVTVPLYRKSQGRKVITGSAFVVPHGPVVHFRVVGIEASVDDFPSSTPNFSIFTSRAFDRTTGRTVVRLTIDHVRFRHGQNDMPTAQPYVNHHQNKGFVYLQNEDSGLATVGQSIQPQATGWWFFALFAVLAGLALVGQALSRQSLIERESYPTLSALGLRPRQLSGLGLLRAGAIGAAGAVGSVVLAYALSDLTPVGEARAAASNLGFVFSGALFGAGALLVVAVVVALAIVPSWRAAQSRRGQNGREVPAGHRNAVVTMVAKTGAPASVVVGVRNALDRGRGRSSVPVVTAVIGATVAVIALVATTVFGASLTHLVTTPPLYGQNWQLDLGNLTGPQLNAALATMNAEPAVTKITWGFSGKYLEVGTTPVEGIFVTVAKGAMAFSFVNGHPPHGDSEIVLGSTTMTQAKLHVGSTVRVAIINKSGRTFRHDFRVVGTVVLPPTFSSGGLGVGAVVPLQAALQLACDGSPPVCKQKLLKSISGWGMAVGIAPGGAGQRTLHRLQRRYSQDVNVLGVPVNLVNFGQAVDFPLLLGVTLALFGAATLAHLLFVSVARRRRQVALLKVLGFVRRQVLVATCWQAVTVVAVGLFFGVPLGVVAGREVWRLFASHLGAVPVAVIPFGLIGIVCAVIIVGGVALSLAPAALAVRVRPAEALREN
ncbi:MAG TPA: ABC transporter permease [Acidimicrobiales bacterium]